MADMDEISKPKRPPPLIDSTRQYICLSIPSSIAMIMMVMTYMMEMAAMRYTFPYCFMLGSRQAEGKKRGENSSDYVPRFKESGRAGGLFLFLLLLLLLPSFTLLSISHSEFHRSGTHPLVEIRLVTFFLFCGPLPRPPLPNVTCDNSRL